MEDLYKILGVSRDANPRDIKLAYRKKASEFHPDKNIGSEEAAEEAFKEIKIAYEILSDADKRHLYNETGKVDNNTISIRDKALQTIAQLFIEMIEMKGFNPKNHNPLDVLIKAMLFRVSEVNDEIKKLDLFISHYEFTMNNSKNTKGENNIFESTSRARTLELLSKKDDLNIVEQVIKLTISITKEHGFDIESMQAPAPAKRSGVWIESPSFFDRGTR